MARRKEVESMPYDLPGLYCPVRIVFWAAGCKLQTFDMVMKEKMEVNF